MLLENDISQITKLYNSINKTDEFEIMFNNYRNDNKLSLNNFVNVLKYLKWRGDTESLEIINEHILDVVYMEDIDKSNNKVVYRVSIYGMDTINNFLKLVHMRKNHIIFSILMTQFNNDSNFIFTKKTKNKIKVVDIDDFDIRVRVASEEKIDNNMINKLANLPISQGNNIIFRLKNRVSLKLIDNSLEKLLLDLTIVKFSDNPNKLSDSEKSFELELDYTSNGKINNKTLGIIFKEIETVKKVLDQTQNLTKKNVLNNIIEKYKLLVYGSNSESFKNLYSMQPISAEVQHIVDKIPNKYSVTDKADGDKFALFIYDDNLYLLSNNLMVKKLTNKLKGYNNTILEGEYIHLTNLNKYLMMCFDCLFFNGKDVRNIANLNDRLKLTDEVCKKLSPSKFEFKNYEIGSGKKYDINDEKKFVQNKIENFYENINSLIDKIKENEIVFHQKLFLFPNGSLDSEVFLFSYLIWYNCTKNEKINCPYLLDGIIYTGVEQKYSKDKRDHKYPTYKFKPPEMNSLDVYIEFQKNEEKGGYLDIFDNSLPDKIENQVFRVVNFFVGDNIGTKEVPIPFMKESENHEAFLPIIKGQVRDIEGNMVQDKTVIEVIYKNDPDIPHQYRWNILRTRWDKTDSVLRHNKKYGNFKDIAVRVWKSMIEAVTIKEIKNLSNPETYVFQKKQLEARIDSTVIVSERKQDIYYQKKTNLAKPMREFHNWVKSVMIYTYCQEFKETKDGTKRRANVLDIGCGRGGDIMKMYHARVGNYVGVDIDYEGIYSVTDGAVSRLKDLKKKFPGFGRMNYVQADGGILLNSKDQIKAIPNMSKENIEMIDKFFSKKGQYDVINSQFNIHYFFGNNLILNNLITNIKDNLTMGGFILITTFDGESIMKLLDGKNQYTSYYTDDDGKKIKFFEIVKKFSGEIQDKPGQSIDVHCSWFMDEGKYQEEYLVTKKMLISTMKKAGCMLLDTELFSKVYNLNKKYFKDVIEFEENPKNKKFYDKVATFYEDLKGADKDSKIYSFLNRYYVFKKIE